MRNFNGLVFGIGINDINSSTATRYDIFYKSWTGMLMRCYSAKYHTTRPSYIQCTVDPDWLFFSVYREWMATQDWRGKALDKDIIIPGCKIYSEESCCFVSLSLNNLLNTNKRGRLPIGVDICKGNKKYRARYRVNGKRINIGQFFNINDAAEAYRKAKSNHIFEIAQQQSDLRIKRGLEIHSQNTLLGAT